MAVGIKCKEFPTKLPQNPHKTYPLNLPRRTRPWLLPLPPSPRRRRPGSCVGLPSGWTVGCHDPVAVCRSADPGGLGKQTGGKRTRKVTRAKRQECAGRISEQLSHSSLDQALPTGRDLSERELQDTSIQSPPITLFAIGNRRHTWTSDGAVEDVGTVGGSNDEHHLGRSDTVNFCQDLVDNPARPTENRQRIPYVCC